MLFLTRIPTPLIFPFFKKNKNQCACDPAVIYLDAHIDHSHCFNAADYRLSLARRTAYKCTTGGRTFMIHSILAVRRAIFSTLCANSLLN